MSDDGEVDWANEYGVPQSKIDKDNSNCVGKEDIISCETIEEGDAVYLEKQCYSKKNLITPFYISNADFYIV
jgi:hypothetical protein